MRRGSRTCLPARSAVGLVICLWFGPSGCGDAEPEAGPRADPPAARPGASSGAPEAGEPGAPTAGGERHQASPGPETVPYDALGRVVTRGGVVDIGLAYDGRVRTLLVGVGQRVRANEEVALVEVPQLAVAAAEAEGLGAQRRVLAERRARVATLVAEGLEPRELLDGVDASLAELGTRREVALATLRAAGVSAPDRAYLVRRGVLRMRAPRDGVLVELLVAEGGVVGPSAPLARLVGASDAVVQVTTARPPPSGPATLLTSAGEVQAEPREAPVLDPSTGLYHTFYPLAQALPHGERVTLRFAPRHP